MNLPEVYIKRLNGRTWAMLSQYHPAVVAAIKSFPGARWDQFGKVWTFGPDVASEILKLAGQDAYPWQSVHYSEEPRGLEGGFLPNFDEVAQRARGYQLKGIACAKLSLEESGAFLLADDRGLGKTFQALKTAQALSAKKILVVCPAIAKNVWLDQKDKWYGNAPDYFVCRGLTGKLAKGIPEDKTFVVVNYDILASRRASRKKKGGGFDTNEYQGWADCLGRWAPDLLILDEAHAVKNKNAARTKALGQIRACAKHCLALTGTPAWNNLLDIHGLMDILFPGTFGTKFQFSLAYMQPYHNGYGWEYKGVNKERLDELQRRLQFYMISRKKIDVLSELPAKSRVIVPIDEGERTQDVGEGKFEENIAQQGLRWLKSAQGLSARTTVLHELSKIKAPYTAEQVRQVLADSAHIVVFCHFKEPVNRLKLALQDSVPVWTITGEDDDKTRRNNQAAWEASARGVLVMTTGAGGVALNLQKANVVVFNDLEWSPSALLQAEDRVHRLGQSLPCTIYYMVVRGTVEDIVAHNLIEKMDAAEKITGGHDSLVSLTEEESLEDIVSAITRAYSDSDEWLEDEGENE